MLTREGQAWLCAGHFHWWPKIKTCFLSTWSLFCLIPGFVSNMDPFILHITAAINYPSFQLYYFASNFFFFWCDFCLEPSALILAFEFSIPGHGYNVISSMKTFLLSLMKMNAVSSLDHWMGHCCLNDLWRKHDTIQRSGQHARHASAAGGLQFASPQPSNTAVYSPYQVLCMAHTCCAMYHKQLAVKYQLHHKCLGNMLYGIWNVP